MTTKVSFEPWEATASDAEIERAGMLNEVDPRVDGRHINGVMPPPPNPPPPVGWAYWARRRISASATRLASIMLHDAATFPMGSFVRVRDHDTQELIGYRVEWHDRQGATGKRGCFRGVNLMAKVPNVL